VIADRLCHHSLLVGGSGLRRPPATLRPQRPGRPGTAPAPGPGPGPQPEAAGDQ
jgi:hypothetical protein